MSKINQKYALVFVFITYVLVQFFFVTKYYTDKTTVPPQIAESMYENQSIVAKNFTCNLPNGEKALYPTWAEEPPVFHFVIIVFKVLGLDLYYFKLLPILCFSLVFLGLFKLASLFVSEEDFRKNYLLIGLIILFQPYFYIHFSRILPDSVSLAFLVWSVYFFFKRSYHWAIPLAFLAVTAKALAIFPLAFIVGFYFFFDRSEGIVKRFLVSTLFALSLVPTLLWFYYLKSSGVLSPFFNPDGGMHHMAGTAFDAKVWTRVLKFGLMRGVSIPIFLLMLYALIKKKKLLLKKPLIYLPVLFVGYLFSIFVIKDIFKTAPWYSFYFITFFVLLGIISFVELEKRMRLVFVICIILPSLQMIDYGRNIRNNTTQKGKELYIDLPCQEHLLPK